MGRAHGGTERHFAGRCHALICVRLCHVAPIGVGPGRGANVGDTI
jgi:hypothetical protein